MRRILFLKKTEGQIGLWLAYMQKLRSKGALLKLSIGPFGQSEDTDGVPAVVAAIIDLT